MALFAQSEELGHIRLDARLPKGFELVAQLGDRLVYWREGEEHTFPSKIAKQIEVTGMDVRWARVKRDEKGNVVKIDDGVVQGQFSPQWFTFSDKPRGNRTQWDDTEVSGILFQIPGSPWCEKEFPFKQWERWDFRVKQAFVRNAIAGDFGLSKETASAVMTGIETRTGTRLPPDVERWMPQVVDEFYFAFEQADRERRDREDAARKAAASGAKK